ncbi:winged helix-turn-helix domain-containing protein [Motilimonas pumila]|uniref:OmpR/PhoB-type domain-containing protein n=1 Tax=Motilimonas pumila TaxID=2303987 RepID=A0A418YD27_9GAMM|nr:winged helix-turn-helix domain-containing protein [Motilimonas pumila]RJG42431.1 hypothetical protein D1Z90_13235 [Motilimonas pumila]
MQFRVGHWQVVAQENKIFNEQSNKTVEPKVMDLLVYLCQHPGKVLSADDLLDKVWSGRVVTGSSIYQTIAQLRKALEDKASAPRYIETVPKKGYKLIAEVAVITPIDTPNSLQGFDNTPRRRRSDKQPQTGAESQSAAKKPFIERRQVLKGDGTARGQQQPSQINEPLPKKPAQSDEATHALDDKGSTGRHVDTDAAQNVSCATSSTRTANGSKMSRTSIESDLSSSAVTHNFLKDDQPTQLEVKASVWLTARQKWLTVSVFCLLLLLVITLFPKSSKTTTIAVLPFNNNTQQPGNHHIADATARGLSHLLNKVKGIQLVAHTSSSAIAKQGLAATHIAESLGADYLIEGQIDELPNQLFRIEIALINGVQGTQYWSGSSKVSWQNIEQQQEYFFQQILAVLKQQNNSVDDLNMQAAQAYEQGNVYRGAHEPNSNDKAIEQYLLAISLNKRHTQAYIRLSEVYFEKYYHEHNNSQWLLKAKGYLYHALSLAPDSAEALNGLSQLQFYGQDYQQARQTARQILAKDNNNLLANLNVSKTYLAELNIHQAQAALAKVLTTHENANEVRALQAILRLYSGDVATAMAALNRLFEQPMDPYYVDVAIAAATATGQSRSALRWIEQRLEKAPYQAQLKVYHVVNLVNVGQYIQAQKLLSELKGLPLERTFSAFEAVYLAQNKASQLLPLLKEYVATHDNVFSNSAFSAQFGLSAVYAGQYKTANHYLRQVLSDHDGKQALDQILLSDAFYRGAFAFALEQDNRPVEAASVRQKGLKDIAYHHRRGVKLPNLDIYKARLHSFRDQNMALRSIGQAIKAGYSQKDFLQHDTVLSPLHDHQQFIALMAQAKLNQER